METTAKTRDEAMAELDTLLLRFDNTYKQLAAIQTILDEKIKKLKEECQGEVDELTVSLQNQRDHIVTLYHAHRDIISEKTKKVALPFGTITAKISSKVVFDDEKKVMAFLRRVGKILKFTTRPKRILSKEALSKDPSFVEKAPGMHMEYKETVTITVPSVTIKKENEVNFMKLAQPAS